MRTRDVFIRRTLIPLLAAILVSLPGIGTAQDANIREPVAQIEDLLLTGDFQIITRTGSRFEGDRTQRVVLQFEDGPMMQTQWARAPRGGDAFNNRPQYEIAAYELQKLFLDESEYVVPPTVARCFPLEEYREIESRTNPTFRNGNYVLVVLQYWLWNVTDEGFDDAERFEQDSAYARAFANFNLYTHLIRHNDENVGNFLISLDPEKPRVFSVDNGLSFGSKESNRGFKYRYLRVDRVPRETIERLRDVTLEELRSQLGVVAHFERDEETGEMVPAEPTENLDPKSWIRQRHGALQIGLKDKEIKDVYERIQEVLQKVDEGELALF